MEMTELLNYVKDEGITEKEIEDVTSNLQLGDLVIPKTLSVESTLQEINAITARLYELHNKQKRDPIPLNKIIALLELKTRIVGMMNIKPEIQDMIDSEINTYKRRFIELAMPIVGETNLEMLTVKLSAEGL